ncbi:MAG: alpha/beta hydrolase fold domain-containing protein [Bryobacteraceae bacterium]
MRLALLASLCASLCFPACSRHPAASPIYTFSYGPDPAQRCHFYLPSNPSPQSRPLAVVVHGGAWRDGSPEEIAAAGLFQPLLDRGFLVAAPAYRLAPAHRAPAAAVDLRNAIAAAARLCPRFSGDPARLLLAGFSAGAHLALLAATAPPGAVPSPIARPAAIVSFWGISDLPALLEDPRTRSLATAWLPDPFPYELPSLLSPLRYADRTLVPVLAFHSRHDPLVPFSQSRSLVEAIDAAGGRATLIELDHRSHAPAAPAVQLLYARVFEFLEQTTPNLLP